MDLTGTPVWLKVIILTIQLVTTIIIGVAAYKTRQERKRVEAEYNRILGGKNKNGI